MVTYNDLIELLSEAEGHLISKLHGNPAASIERAKDCVTKALEAVEEHAEYLRSICVESD